MAFCRNCGNIINDGESFCSQCGTPVASSPSRCGVLTIKWKGLWMLIDAKIHVWANGNPVGDYSFKNGFEVSVPITSTKMLIGIKCWFRSYQPVINVNLSEDYILYIIYSRFTGGFDFILCDKNGKRIM